MLISVLHHCCTNSRRELTTVACFWLFMFCAPVLRLNCHRTLPANNISVNVGKLLQVNVAKLLIPSVCLALSMTQVPSIHKLELSEQNHSIITHGEFDLATSAQISCFSLSLQSLKTTPALQM